jgi:recombination protein U
MMVSTGDSLEKLVRDSVKAQDLAIKQTAPRWRGRVKQGGLIKRGRVVSSGELDFTGHVAGRFVTFDAKSTQQPSLPLKNIKRNQATICRHRHEEGALAFFLVEFAGQPEPAYFAVTWPVLKPYWDRFGHGGPSSIPMDVIRSTCSRIDRKGKTLNLDGALRTMLGLEVAS